MAPLLEIKNLTCRRDDGDGSAILHELNLQVQEGEVVILKGQSGCGKTTLLKCIAELNVYQSGVILYNGKKAIEYGIPKYRTLVQYVPQRPSLLPGTPLDFLTTIRTFAARKRSPKSTTSGEYRSIDTGGGIDPLDLAEEWGIPKPLWRREWSSLSGGEGQRIALAVAVGLGGAEVVLLDEPTSALDEESMKKVERSLISMLPPRTGQRSDEGGVQRKGTGSKAFVWITHEASQADRVGTRTIDLTRR